MLYGLSACATYNFYSTQKNFFSLCLAESTYQIHLESSALSAISVVSSVIKLKSRVDIRWFKKTFRWLFKQCKCSLVEAVDTWVFLLNCFSKVDQSYFDLLSHLISQQDIRSKVLWNCPFYTQKSKMLLETFYDTSASLWSYFILWLGTSMSFF